MQLPNGNATHSFCAICVISEINFVYLLELELALIVVQQWLTIDLQNVSNFCHWFELVGFCDSHRNRTPLPLFKVLFGDVVPGIDILN